MDRLVTVDLYNAVFGLKYYINLPVPTLLKSTLVLPPLDTTINPGLTIGAVISKYRVSSDLHTLYTDIHVNECVKFCGNNL